ncbi:hypothetical protein [Streptomyces sp. 769]|uniref:hypothetical protein n=1 Tax=Streptomyces sp. 769 TaxID=1262452 RepID=UPI0005820F24|nr:hypothetical protein [Streptomyces sp. 769]AJC54734.1 hypothetical protein GZL_02140 [Streptomyces sp. 769]
MLLELAPLREAVKTGVLGGISAISGTSGEGDIGYVGYVGYVAREDCAAVGAALLAEGGHTGKCLDVTGPVAVNYAGIADALTQATGRPVRFEARPEPETATAYAARGAVAAGAGGWTHRRAKDSAPQPHPDRPDRTGRDPDARGPSGLPRGELPRSPYETLHRARGQAELSRPRPRPIPSPKGKGPLLL